MRPRRFHLRRLWALLLGAALLAMALPTSSSAGVAFIGGVPDLFDHFGNPGRSGLAFADWRPSMVADPADANRRNEVTITRSGTTFFVTDRGDAPRGLDASSFCTSVSMVTASCPVRPEFNPPSFQADLGARSDTFRVDAAATAIFDGLVRTEGRSNRIHISGSRSTTAGRFVIDARRARGRNGLQVDDVGTDNVLLSGAGSDVISTFRNGREDRVRCSRGRDRVLVDLQDEILDRVRCESVRNAPKDQHPIVAVKGKRLPVKRGGARVRMRCPKQATSRCQGRLRILRGKRGNRRLGASRYSIRKGKKESVRVRVSRSRGVVRAITRETGPDGRPKQSITQLRLRRR